jgi:hypothetical protein
MPGNGYVSMDINEHFDFIISCDTGLELTCDVYHSVCFVNIVYFFLFHCLSFRSFREYSLFISFLLFFNSFGTKVQHEWWKRKCI